MAKKVSETPTKSELATVLDDLIDGLVKLASSWNDSVPSSVRAELFRLTEPAMEILIKLKRR